MTTQTIRMARPINRYLLVGIPVAILAFLANPHGPLGGFWAPAPDMAALQPTGLQVPLFVLLNLAEAVTFGAGVAFLLFGYNSIQASTLVSPRLARLAHLSIAWFLINWLPHDSLHVHLGTSDSGQLLALEYGFHVTLMIAGAILAVFFARVLRELAR